MSRIPAESIVLPTFLAKSLVMHLPELKPGLNMFSFRLDTMPGKCESDEKVIGLQIGVRGEFCGTMDDSKEFRELAMKMSGVWGIRRI